MIVLRTDAENQAVVIAIRRVTDPEAYCPALCAKPAVNMIVINPQNRCRCIGFPVNPTAAIFRRRQKFRPAWVQKLCHCISRTVSDAVLCSGRKMDQIVQFLRDGRDNGKTLYLCFHPPLLLPDHCKAKIRILRKAAYHP